MSICVGAFFFSGVFWCVSFSFEKNKFITMDFVDCARLFSLQDSVA